MNLGYPFLLCLHTFVPILSNKDTFLSLIQTPNGSQARNPESNLRTYVRKRNALCTGKGHVHEKGPTEK